MGDAPAACERLDGLAYADEDFPPLQTGVSDITGFRTATLAEAGVDANGVLADRYLLDPFDHPTFEEMSGEVWLAREGGYIVRYAVAAVDGDVRYAWSYELEAVGALAAPTLPEACSGL